MTSTNHFNRASEHIDHTDDADLRHRITTLSATDAGPSEGPTPEHIMQIGMGFWASKTLLSAVELELFTVLANKPMTGPDIAARLDLHARSWADFLDSLASLGLLVRHGDGPQATYANTTDTACFLDRRSPAYLGGILEMANSRLYGFWGNLTEALSTGQPQNEAKATGGEFFDSLYADEHRLDEFLNAMQGIQTGNFLALLDQIDLSSTTTLCDVGGGNGTLSALAAQRHPHLRAITFDLPSVKPIAQRTLTAIGLNHRVETIAGDFFVDDLPQADVIVMGNVLHDWDNDQKQTLIRKAYASLNINGRLIAIENVIDDARRQNTFGLLMSLNMLIETAAGSDYTGAQFDEWCVAAGFTRTEIVPLAGPTAAAIAYK
jgi:precorrin-6B methylase 2